MAQDFIPLGAGIQWNLSKLDNLVTRVFVRYYRGVLYSELVMCIFTYCRVVADGSNVFFEKTSLELTWQLKRPILQMQKCSVLFRAQNRWYCLYKAKTLYSSSTPKSVLYKE